MISVGAYGSQIPVFVSRAAGKAQKKGANQSYRAAASGVSHEAFAWGEELGLNVGKSLESSDRCINELQLILNYNIIVNK